MPSENLIHFNEIALEPAQIHLWQSHIEQVCCQRNETADFSGLKESEEIIILAAWAGDLYGLWSGPHISWLHLKSSQTATVAQNTSC